ncbi:hypothetical protein F4815DRAFT_504261 [Daldinia loculata]|uniref:uncharacterized protein n=1 Tax=Daldinia loculata TaxID=103429 RepID=UPI0020C2EA74|nr:uncharacterized protein F4817DRAFT_367111 [Daldinia loculata]KAI1645094.1 hypothetical protein F4817DRAFT_367111 [Daldinia loculata]KAI2773459.1 hypothetical protein F4815DRAFT_504261 [Daldinia loculata]
MADNHEHYWSVWVQPAITFAVGFITAVVAYLAFRSPIIGNIADGVVNLTNASNNAADTIAAAVTTAADTIAAAITKASNDNAEAIAAGNAALRDELRSLRAELEIGRCRCRCPPAAAATAATMTSSSPPPAATLPPAPARSHSAAGPSYMAPTQASARRGRSSD